MDATKTLYIVWIVALLGGCADDPATIDGIDRPPNERGGVELIGVSGRRLGDGDRYRVPLDYEGVGLPIGVERREALGIWNATGDDVTIVRMQLAWPDGAEANWALWAPMRAQSVALDIADRRLPPGGHVDFDVGVRPWESGDCEAWLELVVRIGDRLESRIVELSASAVARSGDAP